MALAAYFHRCLALLLGQSIAKVLAGFPDHTILHLQAHNIVPCKWSLQVDALCYHKPSKPSTTQIETSHISVGSPPRASSLTVRLLVSRSCTRTTELLRLTSPVVGHQQSSVILHQSLLQLVLRVLVNVLLVVGDDRFGNCLSDGVDLRSVTTTSNSDPDVDICEFFKTDDEEGFVDLVNRCQFVRVTERLPESTLKRRISG